MKLLDREIWGEALETLGRNRKRSIITAFGVFWGIFMLIILLALSRGFRNGIDQSMQGVASNAVFVGSMPTTKPFAGFREGRTWSLEERDLVRLRARIPELEVAAGSVTMWNWSEDNLRYGDKRTSGAVVGVTPGYFDVVKVKLLHGRLLTESDHREVRKYCLLGERSAQQLFGEDISAAVGKVIKVNRGYYTIVGIVNSPGGNVQIGASPRTSVFVPYAVANIVDNHRGQIYFAQFSIAADANNKQVIERIKEYLYTQHQIAPDDDGATMVFDVSDVFSIFRGISLGINILVWIVGIGTLLTGVVGISNILLVSIRERTQEIGVRRAIGARPLDIIAQLLIESLSLTLLSGLLGIVCGVMIVGGMSGMSFGEDVPFVAPSVGFGVVSIALFVIVLSGLLAGFLPALKAIEVRAIEAIREE